MLIQKISFSGMPDIYQRVDNVLSRSAQPKKEDFEWLKEQGVTDIIDLKAFPEDKLISFNEQETVEKLGMKYHRIRTITPLPSERKVDTFLALLKSIGDKNGKAHVHCFKGVDRTGMYTFIYKTLNKNGNLDSNKQEWIDMGHNKGIFPFLIGWATKFINSKNNSN